MQLPNYNKKETVQNTNFATAFLIRGLVEISCLIRKVFPNAFSDFSFIRINKNKN